MSATTVEDVDGRGDGKCNVNKNNHAVRIVALQEPGKRKGNGSSHKQPYYENSIPQAPRVLTIQSTQTRLDLSRAKAVFLRGCQ
jgi:hypothetical protein